MLEEIERVLEEKVRPELRLHSGDIEALSFEDGVFRFRFLGQCSGCPSAYLTTQQLVESALTSALPAVKRAVLVQEVSESLLDQARTLLRHG